jgi:hypothetical protein
MSRMIPNNSTTPTIMKLYYFSHLCVHDPLPHPETNSDGIEIHLKKAEKTTSAAPKIPNPSSTLTGHRQVANINLSSNTLRRSPRRHNTHDDSSIDPVLYLEIKSQINGAYLGCKGWRGRLSTGRTMFAKLWDGWKFSSQYCDHETSVYLRLRDLWGTVVPEFLGSGDWGFCHVLLLSYIEVLSILYLLY